jgi:hypothetical protein
MKNRLAWMDKTSSSDPSRALFTLAGGVEVATGQTMLEAVGRAKLASILFDEVVMESGLHVVEMSATSPAAIRRLKAATISHQLLEDTRIVERGTKTGIVIRRVGNDEAEIYAGINIPRFPDALFQLEREVEFRYVSEYHTGLLDELARLGADWVSVIEVQRNPGEEASVEPCQLALLSPTNESDEPYDVLHLNPEETRAFAEQLSSPATRNDQAEGHARASRQLGAVPANAGPHESMLAEDLAEAVHVANHLDAVPTLSSAFERIASERGVPVGIPGAESLGFVIPNFSVLPWEAIARFRNHQGAVEARGRLRTFEVEAAAREPYGSAELMRDTAREVTKGLLGVVGDLAPKLSDDLRGPLVGSSIGLVPVVGQYASLAVSMGDAISALRQHRAFEGSWVAAILELRDAAVDTLIDW